MKSKIVATAVVAMILVSSLFLLSSANAACNLPATVNYSVGPGAPPVIITLSGIGAGYDITNIGYTGYCIELGTIVVKVGTATPICTDGAGSPWNEINWLLNNYPDNLDLQEAIWLLQGNSWATITGQGWPYSTTANNMYLAALGHSTFDPSAGQWVGVRLVVTDAQDFLIKIRVPGGQGLTPGFWKNHPDVWPSPYTPGTSLDVPFDNPGGPVTLGSYTLLDALQFQGGPGVDGAEMILLRAAVAALLNSKALSYPLTTAQVISQVNAALATNDRPTILALASQLDASNNLGA